MCRLPVDAHCCGNTFGGPGAYATGCFGATSSLIANIHAALQHVKAAAEQIKSTDRWAVLLRYVSDKMAPVIAPFRLPQALPGTG